MPTATGTASTATKTKKSTWYVTPLRVVAVLIALGALGVFSYWAARITLTPVADNGNAVGNTEPGSTLKFYLDRPFKEAMLNLGGNLALLAPLGVLLPVVVSRLRGPLRLALVSALISLFIEVAQGMLVPGRAFDTDDVILNTIGVVLAYLLVGRRLARLIRGPK